MRNFVKTVRQQVMTRRGVAGILAMVLLPLHGAFAEVERYKTETEYVSRLVELGYVILQEDFEGSAFEHIRSVFPGRNVALSVTSRQITWSSASHELWPYVPTTYITTNPNWARGAGWGLYDTELASTIEIDVPSPVYGVGLWVDTNPDFEDVGFLLRDRTTANTPGYVLAGYGAMYPGDNAASGHEFIGIIDTNGFSNVVVTGTLEVNEEGQLEGATVLGTDDFIFAVDLGFLTDPLEHWRASHFAVTNLLDETKEATLWGSEADPDNDGANNQHEFVADTIPTDASSFLGMSRVSTTNDYASVEWHGGVAATQFLDRTTALASPAGVWDAIFTNAPPTSVSTEFADAMTTNRTSFYRIRAAR